jgi:hypothetical protein
LSTVGELVAELAPDPLLGEVLAMDAVLPDGPPSRAAAGPRASADSDGYRFALEAIREGHRLHYGAGLLVSTGDMDLRLLAGDRLYAAGLERMARIGDLAAIAELSLLIQDCARAAADGDRERAEAAWSRSAALIGGLGGESARAGKGADEGSVPFRPV